MTCHVYMIRAGEYCKIGITGDLMARLSTIQTCNPLDVSLLASNRYDNAQDALAVENAMHDRFGFRFGRVKGEWFHYSSDESFKEFCDHITGRYSIDSMRSYRDAHEEITTHRNYCESVRRSLAENYSGLEVHELFVGDRKRTPIIDATDRRTIVDYLNSIEA